jgi:hypothetical protein
MFGLGFACGACALLGVAHMTTLAARMPPTAAHLPALPTPDFVGFIVLSCSVPLVFMLVVLSLYYSFFIDYFPGVYQIGLV